MWTHNLQHVGLLSSSGLWNTAVLLRSRGWCQGQARLFRHLRAIFASSTVGSSNGYSTGHHAKRARDRKVIAERLENHFRGEGGVVVVPSINGKRAGKEPKVVLADINEELLLSTCEDIKQKTGGEAVTVVADVSKEEDNKRIVETAVSTFGGLHVSFLNAGRHVPVSIVDFTEEQFDTLFGVNVKGVAFGLKHQLSAMSKTGDKGSVIITSSIVATKTFAKCDLYGSSKAAAAMLVKYGAVEGAAMNVRVNGIAPGLVRSGITKSLGEEKMQQTSRDMHLTKKVIATEQVAPLVVFLASDDAAVITGSIHPIDAGAAAVF